MEMVDIHPEYNELQHSVFNDTGKYLSIKGGKKKGLEQKKTQNILKSSPSSHVMWSTVWVKITLDEQQDFQLQLGGS